MVSEGEWIDVAAAAERQKCSAKSIRRQVKDGHLTARKEKSSGRDGRQVIKTWIRASDLGDAFGDTARDEHVRKIRASARPLTAGQKIAIRNVFLEHFRERESDQRRGG